MLAWSSLLVQKIDLRVRGLAIRRLRINRHRVAEVAPHRHEHGQAILFLSGEGVQSTPSRAIPARSGDLFVFPAGCDHGYQPNGRATPICLVLDYERQDGRHRTRFIHRRLDTATMGELHGLVSRLPRKGGSSWSDYATIAAVVALLFEKRESTPHASPRGAEHHPLHPRLRAMLSDPAHQNTPLSEFARRVGYQPDYLNRKLRRESGQGLRDLRDSIRLEQARAALRAGATVGDAATASGFGDPAYFARWFRKHTGTTPGSFRSDTGPGRA
jgi:AraC-like DNA-binding protein